MMKNETLLSGGPTRCQDCGVMPELKVHHSPAGYYIGTWCNCGPHSRESGYYASRELAEKAMKKGPQEYKR